MENLREKAAFASAFNFAASSLSLSDTSLRVRFSREGEVLDVMSVEEVETGEDGTEESELDMAQVPRKWGY